MAQNAVLGTPGAEPDEVARTAASPASDPVRVAAGTAWWAGQQGNATHRRPLDVQYWACWIFAIVYPLLMVHLWLAR